MAKKEKTLREAAISVFTPPFRFDYGYISDSKNLTVADNNAERDGEVTRDGKLLLQVRGWGHIQKIKGPHKPEDIQDEIGRLIAEGLSLLWKSEMPRPTGNHIAVDRGALQMVLNILERGTPVHKEAAEELRLTCRDIHRIREIEVVSTVNPMVKTLNQKLAEKHVAVRQQFEKDFLLSPSWEEIKKECLEHDPNFKVDKLFQLLTVKDRNGEYVNDVVWRHHQIQPHFIKWFIETNQSPIEQFEDAV